MTGHVQPQKRSTTTLSACIFNLWKSIFVKTMREVSGLSRKQRTESVENMQWGAQVKPAARKPSWPNQ